MTGIKAISSPTTKAKRSDPQSSLASTSIAAGLQANNRRRDDFDERVLGWPGAVLLIVHADDQGVPKVALDVGPKDVFGGIDPDHEGHREEPLGLVSQEVPQGEAFDRPDHVVRVGIETSVSEEVGPALAGPEVVYEAASITNEVARMLGRAEQADLEQERTSGHQVLPGGDGSADRVQVLFARTPVLSANSARHGPSPMRLTK